MSDSYVAWWCRRDMRLDDNAALYHALDSGEKVVPVFIFDRHILDELPEKDARVNFIHDRIQQLDEQLRKMESSFQVFYGTPEDVWKKLVEKGGLKAVYLNRDYEPYAKERDGKLAEYFEDQHWFSYLQGSGNF